MASERSRFVKSYPSFIRSAIWKDDGLFKLYHYCLYKASRNLYTWHSWQGRKIHPGELPISHRNAAAELCWSKFKLDKKLTELQATGLIDITCGAHGTLITVNNWDDIQSGGLEISPKCQGNQDTSDMENNPDWDEKQDDSGLKTAPNLYNNKNKERYIHEPAGFCSFWLMYPSERRNRREEAAALFANALQQGATEESLMTALAEDKNSFDWNQENGRYIPGIVKWLQKEKWRDHLPKVRKGDEEAWKTW